MPAPQFFDLFGFLAFLYITCIAFLILRDTKLPRWALVLLLLIGVGGVLVDGIIVYTFYILQ